MRLHRLLFVIGFAWLVLAPRGAAAGDDVAAEEAPAAAEDQAPAPVPDSPEYKAAFEGIGSDISADDRSPDQQLAPSLTAEQLRAMVKVAREKVLARMQQKMEAKAAARMAKISTLIGYFSLSGLLLLLMPVLLRKRYPGRGAMLFKYSALAAVTFVVTVNLFGGVVLGFRTAQASLGAATNPQLKIASAFFDTIDDNAEDYLVVAKELFAPTLAQLQGDSDEQPAVLLIENGKKVIKDADVFVTVAHAFKKVDFVFAALPTLLLLVTLVLFVLAIKPTLLEIVRLPITAATGGVGVGRGVVKRALRRVVGELVATIGTIGVLIVLTLLAGVILGRVVGPALDALIGYFSLGVMYLQFIPDASSGLVFVMLFGVIVFLVLNLGVVIASMSLFLGKAQRIFQRRCNDGVPLREHARFWKWGIPAVLLAQLLPWLYIAIAQWGIEKLDDRLMGEPTDPSQIPWKAIMVLGPLVLVAGFAVVYWAGRGFKSIMFLAKHKVVPPL